MKYYIETYGCQMNVADSELVMDILEKAGHQAAKTISEADVILFNTCSVRQHAEERVIGRVNNEMKRKKRGEVRIGVIGCMAQRLGNELKNLSKGVDFVVGTDQYLQLPAVIERAFRDTGETCIEVNNSELYRNIAPKFQDKHRAFITIMRGCNNFCSYCIVPYTRGRERSRCPEDIIGEAQLAVQSGRQEVMLLGQNVNSYLYDAISFPELLLQVSKVKGLKRIRFTTSHSKDLSSGLISAMATIPQVCEHIHLALQSGDNEILRRMNRGYTAEHYYKLIKELRQAVPHIAVTTDLIAGFPGETEEQFERTLALMAKIRFDYAFMFKYSQRTGTKASEFKDQVAEKVRLERLQRMIKLQEAITTAKYKEKLGNIEEIYVEGISRRCEKELAGKTRDFKVTVFPGGKGFIGKFVNVKITEAAGWTLRGELV